MGAIRNAVKSFDSAPAVANEQKALVAALDKMAAIKLAQMKAEINELLLGAGSGTNLTIPVVAIEDQNGETHASTIDKLNTTISDAVKKSTSNFVTGGTDNIVSGITNLISATAETLLGSGASEEGQVEKYYVAMIGIALWRIDLRGWYYQVQSSGISTQIERCSAFYYTRSTVDVRKMNKQSFFNQYQSIAKTATPTPTPKELLDELDILKQLYNALISTNANRLSSPIF
jgi:hypothetical protein